MPVGGRTVGGPNPVLKLSYDHGANAYAFAFFHSALAVPMFIAIGRASGISFDMPRQAWTAVSASISAISFGYTGAVARIPASLATMSERNLGGFGRGSV